MKIDCTPEERQFVFKVGIVRGKMKSMNRGLREFFIINELFTFSSAWKIYCMYNNAQLGSEFNYSDQENDE